VPADLDPAWEVAMGEVLALNHSPEFREAVQRAMEFASLSLPGELRKEPELKSRSE
jgi:hypothetical protein